MSNPTQPILPVFLSVSPTKIAIAQSGTVQLVPVLIGSDGNTFAPTAAFTYDSSNTALATVSDTGLVTAYTPADPNVLNEGGIVTITVTYPFSNRSPQIETISADSVIKVLATPAVSIFSPTAPGISGGDASDDFTYLQTHTGAHRSGAGVRVVPEP